MHPISILVPSWNASGTFAVLDEWFCYPSKRSDSEASAIQQRWNERLKRRLQKEVEGAGANNAARKM